MEFSTAVSIWIFILSIVFNGIDSARVSKTSSLRTGYHFQPRKNWINAFFGSLHVMNEWCRLIQYKTSDPNGPMYYNGVYHLFYQYNPKGAVWGNIRWAHSVSKDLINWKRLPIAIEPSKPFDKYGCWSGSATILPGNKPVILYTGIIDQNNTQVQNYAIPENLSDPFLAKWTKPDNNPLIVAHGTINKTAFRDPTTGWKGKDGFWRVSLGGRNGDTGIVFLYKSKDFLNWTEDHPLHTVPGTGNFECPDFYPVSIKGNNGLDTSARGPGIKHVLKVSLDATRYEYYTIGTYIPEKGDKYTPDQGMVDGWNGLRYDYGNFYASKTFFDPKTKRRILWGWANESDSTADDVKKGWAGIQLIPRTVELDSNGKQLVLWPIQEVKSLRGDKVKLSDQKLKRGEKIEIKGITPAQADVEVTFSFASLNKSEPFNSNWSRYDAQKLCSEKSSSVPGGLGPFGIITLASKHLEEYTPVFFRIFKDRNKHVVLMCSDASRSSLKKEDGAYRPSFAGFVDVDLSDKKISLRSLIDNSVVESFGARGKTCISSRVYPTLATYGDAHLFAFNNGTETITIDTLEAWSMNKPRRMN